MSTYVRAYYKAISTEQANRIKAYVSGALRKIDSNELEKFFMPLLGSLKNGHRYLVFGCKYPENGGKLRLHRVNAYFQHPDHYDLGDLNEINGNMAWPFDFPDDIDFRIGCIIRKFVSFLFEDNGTDRLQREETPESGGDHDTGSVIYGEPDRIEYATGRPCDQATVVCERAGVVEPEACVSLRSGRVRESSC